MERNELVKYEMARFPTEQEINYNLAFRVAIGGDAPGHYAYGTATERREYNDHTVGYTVDRTEAILLLADAFQIAKRWNEEA